MDARYAKFVPDVEAFLNRIGSQEYYDAQLHGVVADKKDDAKSTPATAVSDDEEYGDEEYVAIEEETTAERLRRKMANQQ